MIGPGGVGKKGQAGGSVRPAKEPSARGIAQLLEKHGLRLRVTSRSGRFMIKLYNGAGCVAKATDEDLGRGVFTCIYTFLGARL